MGWMMSWRTYRQRQHAKAEAKQLIGEARRILKKKRLRIPETVTTALGEAIGDVELARKQGTLEEFHKAMGFLDETLTKHLGFARKSSARQYVESIGIALAVALLLRAFVVEAFQIPSGSMIPTLEIGDHIFVSKFAYSIGLPFSNIQLLTYGKPKRGDVIVFKYPPDQSVDYIKRVVGLSGETVEVRRNEVFINGKPMDRQAQPGPCETSDIALFGDEYERAPCELWREQLDGHGHFLHQDPRQIPSDFPPMKIPEGHYFVMGDNRDNSKDSRVWGFVPADHIKGKALVIWWSRDPARGGLSPSGIVDWFASIRGRRFFQGVK